MTGLGEADICRKFVVPKLQAAGWDDEPHSIAEQRTFTDGRIIVAGQMAHHGKKKRADYLLRYTRDFPIAVVEAKAEYKTAGAGLQQAKEYAEILGLKFAYATNGTSIIEFDFTTGLERELNAFPTPSELWDRLAEAENIPDHVAEKLLTPYFNDPARTPRYYQQIAINRTVQNILQEKKRILLTMATGTGKTVVAFQICWKLWSGRWNRSGEHRRPRILFLADRNVLIDDPKDKTFIPFGDARHKIENGQVVKSREMYFAIYQAIAKDENRPGLYKEFGPDFFDLIVVDECHRGSARDDSNWREILEYFESAYQIGMTATPLREDNRNTYRYFGGKAIYTYSLRQGIDDGFLAPYRVHRVVTDVDATGYRPNAGEIDRYGREIPDDVYETKDFERVIALRARTRAIARHLTSCLKKNDRFGKTIVFCVDQEHADEMRRELANLNADIMRRDPNYVCRVTSEEGAIGRGHLSRFQDVETDSPVILTTSKLLTTGVDAPTVKNVVLARVVGSMTEFKQIIGRGSRVREDYGKTYFTILDFTGSATQHFADPEFDGEPDVVEEVPMEPEPQPEPEPEPVPPDTDPPTETDPPQPPLPPDPPPSEPRKLYVDGGQVTIAADVVYELDADGRKLRTVEYTDYTAEKVRTLCRDAEDLRQRWIDPTLREQIVQELAERGIEFGHLAEQAKQPDADPFDLLCHLAFNAPLLTRRQRAEKLRRDKQDLFDQYGPEARAILNELLDKYADHGIDQFSVPDVLKVPPVSRHGNIQEIISHFGGPDQLRDAVTQLQANLYAA
jgi:type I restriction enzyme R subunit